MKKIVLASLITAASLFAGNAGIEITYNKTKASKSHSLLSTSAAVDIRDDLGMNSKDSHINAKLWKWINSEDRITLGYEALTFDGKVANNAFSQVNGSVTSIDIDWFNLGYANKLAGNESYSILAGIDVNLVSAQEKVGTLLTKSKLQVLPTLALEALYDFDGLGIDGKIAGMYYGDKGSYYEGRAGIFADAPFFDNATLRAGYQAKIFNNVDYKVMTGDYKFAGWYVGLGATFGGAIETPVSKQLLKVDSDNDGIVNSKDLCPSTPAGLSVDKNGCELDSDNDGVVNSKDLCANTTSGATTNANGCELDSDNDGVVNSKDLCSNTAKDAKVNTNGCIANVTLNIKFPFNSNKVSSKYLPKLKTIASSAVRNNLKLVVEGHTDSIGSKAYNKSLSLKRAVAVSKILVQNGVKAINISAIGMGETKPVVSNMSRSGRAQNRRIVIKTQK